jgi:hypothetical protein
MSRFGWFLFALGLMVVAGSAARLAWITIFDSTTDDVGAGFLFAAGYWGGIIVAAFGAAAVTRARGMSAPSLRG